MLTFAITIIKEKVMKKFIKKSVFAVLVILAVLVYIGVDVNQFGHWLKVEGILVGSAWFWWWITDLKEIFAEEIGDKDNVA